MAKGEDKNELKFKTEKLLSKRPFAKKSKNIKWLKGYEGYKVRAEQLKQAEEYSYNLSNVFREYKQFVKDFDSEMQKVYKKGRLELEDSVKEKFKKRFLKIDDEYDKNGYLLGKLRNDDPNFYRIKFLRSDEDEVK